MDSNDANDIINDILDALNGYECEVDYCSPTSDGQCGYFWVSINDDYDSDDIEDELESVVEEHDLDFDWSGSDHDLDLNAYWDEYEN